MKPPKCLHCAALLLLAVFALGSLAKASWKEKVLYSFQGGTDGSTPAGGVVFDAAGNLYGATEQGGGSDCKPTGYCGTVFQLKPPTNQGDPWTETLLHVFAGVTATEPDGADPAGGLVIDAAGNLYGTTAYGGSGNCVLVGIQGGCGTVFELEPPKTKGGAWAYKILYSLQGGKDGHFPWGDLVFDGAGNLYGATQFGGGYGSCDSPFYQFCGTVFEMSPPKIKGGKWTEKVLHGFKGGTDGANPNGGLLLDSKGAVYGTTFSGGGSNCKTTYSVGCGTTFKLNPPSKNGGAWSEKILRRFEGGTDGAAPNGGLASDAQVALYGSTSAGGNGDGTVFKLARGGNGGSWVETLLHRFRNCGISDGCDPVGRVWFDSAGHLYGATCCGSSTGGGTIFRLSPSKLGVWAFSVLHSFTGKPDGFYPAATLIFAHAGVFFGATQYGGSGQGDQNCGSDGCGVVFQMSP
jgi:uncharacterized repeat protein (TIGR03803 family)